MRSSLREAGNTAWHRGARVAVLVGALAAGGRAGAQSAYITNIGDNTISVVDTARDVITASFPAPGTLTGLAVSPDGAKLYVASGQNHRKNTVLVLDAHSGRLIRTIEVGDPPAAVAVSPDGATVYSAEANFLTIIDAVTGHVSARLSGTSTPASVAVSPDGRTVFVSAAGEGGVVVVDAATHAVKANIDLPGLPGGLACSPDGAWVYVADTENGTLAMIDTARNAIAATIPVGRGPFGVAVTPDGSRVYVTNSGRSPREHGAVDPGSVSVVDLARRSVATIAVGDGPHGIAVTPDGRKAYVVNAGSGSLSVLDTHTGSVTRTVVVGHGSWVAGGFIGPAASPH